jgi:ribulose-phosphate 3-epimerase
MITEPEKYAERFAEAGSDHITFHIETVKEPAAFVRYLRGLGVTVGVTLNPGTPVEAVENIAPQCDMVLVMTVQPGFGGQAFMDDAAKKCIRLRQIVAAIENG